MKYTEQAVETLDDAGSVIANKNIEIEQLRQQLAEKDAELINYKRATDLAYKGSEQDTLDKIAAAQAREQQLREALVKLEWDGHDFDNQGVGYQCCSGCGNREELGKHTVHCLVGKALAIPTNSTQILDEVRKQERERCAALCEKSDRYRGDYFAAKIRGME